MKLTFIMGGAALLLTACQAIEGDMYGEIAKAMAECDAIHKAGILKSYSEAVACENQAHSAVLIEYRYPFMQSVNAYHVQKAKIAKELDGGKISKEEATLQIARASDEFNITHQQNLQGMYGANTQQTNNLLGTMILMNELQRQSQPPAPKITNCNTNFNGNWASTRCTEY